MLDYQTKAYSQYGASMGRRSDLPSDTTAVLQVRHVPINDGGYDPGGAYWGTPNNLYCVTGDHDDAQCTAYVRASSADAARAEFPNATWAPVTGGPSDEDLAEMLESYIECALWSTNDNSDEQGGEPLDANYSADDIASETRYKMKLDVDAFGKANATVILACLGHGKCDWARAGHDLWLTRNGHGCGFWDGDWPKEAGEALTKASEALGNVDLYVGDDGKVHQDRQ